MRNYFNSSAAKGILFSALCFGASSAIAAANGWGAGVANVQALGTDLANMLVYVFFAAGVGAFGYAGKKLWDKGQEGRGDDIKAMHIIWPMLGGAFLMAISWVAGTTMDTLGKGTGNSTTPSRTTFGTSTNGG